MGRDDAEEWSVKDVVLYLGDIHAALEPTRVKTLLGSCMAVCLYDPVQAVGGMNHFMLPRGGAGDGEAARFGIQAMEGLIAALLRIGGARRRLVAKVFGGAHVLDIEESQAGVPRQNIEFTRTFLAAGGIPVLAEDVGGYDPRHVHFHTATGRVFCKRALTERIASTAPPDRAVTLS